MAKGGKKSSGTRVVKARVAFRGPVFYVTSEMVKEPSGITARRDIVRHPGSVVIMVVDDEATQEARAGRKQGPQASRLRHTEPRVLLARQYRYAADERLWELPAGRIDPGEAELAAAKRELIEETGYTARHWSRPLFFYVSPGFLDETMAIYMARGLVRGEAKPEEDEVIAKRFFPLSAAVRMVMTGKIRDAKTIAAVLWLREKTRS